MQWQITNDAPVYAQLIAHIRQAIASGAFQPGERLPSVRDLALEAGVNPNTMQRALQELEREGLIVTAAGKGSFVAERNADWLREDVLRRIEDHLQQISQLAAQIGLSGEDLCEMLQTLRLEEE